MQTPKTLILAHNYQRPEIQERADYTGDSLKLCQIARDIACDDIVFCGVDFMAETAVILNPEKRVFMPEPLSQCPMAHQVTPDEVIQARKEHPHAAVVSYVNTTAVVKAVSDVICTSANAEKVINKIEEREIIFVPDKNLASYVGRFTDKKIIVVPEGGNCPVHHQLSYEDIVEAKKKHPQAKVAVHPECQPEVIDAADYVGGTEGILNYVKTSPQREFIIGTENGMLHKIQKACDEKKLYPASVYTVCPNMKMTTLKKLEKVLREKGEKNQIRVDPRIAERARESVERMFELMR